MTLLPFRGTALLLALAFPLVAQTSDPTPKPAPKKAAKAKQKAAPKPIQDTCRISIRVFGAPFLPAEAPDSFETK